VMCSPPNKRSFYVSDFPCYFPVSIGGIDIRETLAVMIGSVGRVPRLFSTPFARLSFFTLGFVFSPLP